MKKVFEINLVPEVKRQMLKAQRVRNIVLFVCIVLSAAAIITVLSLLGVKSGQDIALSNQDKDLKAMSEKIHEFDNLDQFITIQDQLDKLSTISENKKAASRLFGLLATIQPVSDEVTYSELRLNLGDNSIAMEGQVQAGPNTDGIDYRALESFRKGIALTKYDYGHYVDKQGSEIPYYCIEEDDGNGNPLKEGDKYYANWYVNRTDCNPSKQSTDNQDKDYKVQIWRTPQFKEWYDQKHITDKGEISGVEHFESQCLKYSSTDNGKTWKTEDQDSPCLLAKDGLNVSESSNGLNDSDQLVLRFTGSISLDEKVLALSNRHMRFISPSGQNVTDSYNQVKDMFEKRASDCDKKDPTCQNTTKGDNTNE